MDIYLGKLLNGMTIIGYLDINNNKLNKCVTVQMKQSQQNINIALLPVFFGLSSELVDISLDKILCTIPADTEIKAEYLKATSGIEIVSDLSQIRTH